MESWQEERLKFYQNSSALEFIEKYFEVQKGIRTIVCHKMDMLKNNGSPIYRMWSCEKCRGYTLNENKYAALTKYGCVHSLIYTFDANILENHPEEESKSMFLANRVGLNGVIELDTPDDPNSDKALRLSFFDYIQQYDKVIKIITDKLDDLTTDYNIQFSGNGIYIILEGYYEDDLLEVGGFKDNFKNLLDELREANNDELKNKDNVHICNTKAPWNKYFKIPFTFHETRPRMSIPLPKGKLDKDYIDRVSNVNNIYNDYAIIDEVIKKANWRQLW